MTVVPVYVLFVAVIGFAGALFHELGERTSHESAATFY